MPSRSATETLVGRTLMVAPPAGWIEGSTTWLDSLQPAGVILFRRNLPADLEIARRAIARLHAWAAARGETFLVAMDEEGGFVTQTSPWFPVPPSARALAWAAEPDAVQDAFRTYGGRLRWLGVNLDFAPVCDVNVNPNNPVIGVRSFGDDPDRVTAYARAVHLGLREAGLLSCVKHFPGHGDTDVDSHLALPVLQHDRARLERVELVPFRALVAEAPVVMVAHLACPQLGDGELPATLAPRIATQLLRGDLGFAGVAVTDAMDMQGVAAHYGVEEAAVQALAAGCDLLLYCFEIDKPQRAREAVLAALDSGRLPRARVEEAAARVAHLQALAASAGEGVATAPPLGLLADDAARYRDLCARALRVLDPQAWRVFARVARERGGLALVGWPAEVLERLAARVRQHGLDPALHDALAFEEIPPETPVLVVLGERRPLASERVACLRRLALERSPVALANLLTPEIDTPLVESFTTLLRSADHSDAMLEVVAARIADLDNPV